MKNAIFTICAKNYLAHAKSLGESIEKYHSDVDFYILLSDEINEEDIKSSKFVVIESKNIGINNFYEMAFKYDVIEFSTSIKPFFFDILLREYEYDKILYIDPDICVYKPLNGIFEDLDSYDALLTPHLIKPYLDYEGATSEEELLFVGIYNLGFFGVKNSHTGLHIIQWWKNKLKDQCYADKEDALHVDQKWMDFLPALYGDRVKISRHSGMNVAFWNMHERNFSSSDSGVKVDGQDLVFFHFSGLDVDNFHDIARKQNKYNLTNMPQYKELFSFYVESLLKNDYKYHNSQQYTYNTYSNGVYVLKYQRRLFRSLIQNENTFNNPFDSLAIDGYYQKLKSNKLMIYDKEGKLYALKKTYKNIDSKIMFFHKILNLLCKIIGIKHYYLFMRLMAINNRFEKQVFLIKN